MKSTLFLAWRYVTFHRGKSSIIVVCLSLTFLLPLAVNLLLNEYDARLHERSRRTPLVLGARGNRYDLLLAALYFRRGEIDPVPARLVEEVRQSGLARALPLHVRFSAQGLPVVGTDLEYFAFRGLRPRDGRLPGLLGEAVVGHAAAAALSLRPGSTVLTDQRSLYDISRNVPLKLRVVGILEPAGTADDHAIFVDTRTAWIVEGIGHGHTDLSASEAAPFVRERDERHVTANAALGTHVEITPENVGSFHFHGDRGTFPLTAVIALPADDKGRVLLKTRYNASEDFQALAPVEVVDELLGLVFRVKKLFDAQLGLVTGSTLLLVALVVLLSLRLRRAERETLHKIGGSRSIVFWLQSAEIAILAAFSVTLTAIGALALVALAPDLFGLLR